MLIFFGYSMVVLYSQNWVIVLLITLMIYMDWSYDVYVWNATKYQQCIVGNLKKKSMFQASLWNYALHSLSDSSSGS